MCRLPTDASRFTSFGSSTSTSSPTTATMDPQTGQLSLCCCRRVRRSCVLFVFFPSFVRTAIPFTQEPQRDKPANVQPYYLYGSKVGLHQSGCFFCWWIQTKPRCVPLSSPPAASEHRLLSHIQLLQKLCWPSALQDDLPSPRLPGHRCSHGGTPENCQEPGTYVHVPDIFTQCDELEWLYICFLFLGPVSQSR